MSTNRQAMRKVGRSLADLLKVREDYGGLTAAEQQANERSISALKTEYVALSGASPTATYAEITAALTGAKANLEEIKAKRDKFENALITSAKLLGTLSAVLKLIS